jgi:hypothetical protein
MRTHSAKHCPKWNAALMSDDMEELGWLKTDLARAAELSDMTVSRFFRGKQQNARTAKKLADALGKPVRRYRVASLVRSRLAS